MEKMPQNKSTYSELRMAMNISLGIGVLMLVLKMGAYVMTGSSAILSDAAESVVHLFAVAFASYSLRLSYKPADLDHPYGHSKISFFSAGFEGGMIVLAALYIIYTSIHKWMTGLELENIGAGSILTASTVLINGALGAYLIWLGKKKGSIILEANGHHVLTDCWTSIGVLAALGLIFFTGWLPWDPIFGILMGLNILYAGYKLISKSVSGLMDEADPSTAKKAQGILEEKSKTMGFTFHDLRVRSLGDRNAIEVHLLFLDDTRLDKAHDLATEVEDEIAKNIEPAPYILTHLEPMDKHSSLHHRI